MSQQLPLEYDLQSIREAADGDLEMFQQLVGLLITTTQEHLAAIKKAVMEKKSDTIRISAHLLKGTLLQIEANRVVRVVQQLEDLGGESDIPAATQIWPQLEQQVNGLMSAIEKEIV